VIPSRATLAGLSLGDGLSVAVMGVLNVSPESFHAGSVVTRDDDLLRAALAMVGAGAALIDVGARSTAPYLATEISEAEECLRLVRAVELLVGKLPVPVSADTARPAPARAALEAGARVINDVSGLRDPAVAALVAQHHAGVILMAAPARAGGGRASSTTLAVTRPGDSTSPDFEQRAEATGLRGAPAPGPDPVATVKSLLGEALERARTTACHGTPGTRASSAGSPLSARSADRSASASPASPSSAPSSGATAPASASRARSPRPPSPCGTARPC